jgi:phage shock protein C
MNFYRNTKAGKIGGVCAGIADHLNFDPWIVRLLSIGAFFVLGSLVIVAYIIGWIFMSPRRDDSVEIMEYDEFNRGYRHKTLFKHSPSPSERLRRAQDRLSEVLHRTEALEACVTSTKFELNKEFSKIKK